MVAGDRTAHTPCICGAKRGIGVAQDFLVTVNWVAPQANSDGSLQVAQNPVPYPLHSFEFLMYKDDIVSKEASAS